MITGFINTEGGVIFAYDSKVTLKDILFENNTATQDGAVVHLKIDKGPIATMSAAGCLFRDNTADGTSASGGVISFDNPESAFGNHIVAECESCRFENNKAPDSGGAINAINTDLTLTYCHFKENSVLEDTGAGGGAVHHATGDAYICSLTIRNSFFQGNEAITEGQRTTMTQAWQRAEIHEYGPA